MTCLQFHALSRAFFGLLLCGTLFLSACAPETPSVLAGQGATTSAEAKKKATNVEVELDRTAKTEITRAKRQLIQNYDEFLERKALGFNLETVDHLGPAVAKAWDKGNKAMDGLAESTSLRNAFPLVIVSLFLLLLVVVERQTWRIAMFSQARATTVWWDWLHDILRLSVLVVGRTAPVALLVLLSYFPVQAVFARAQWTHALTSLLWLLLGYRACLTAVQATFALDVFDVADEHANRLQRFGRRVLQLVFGALALVSVAEQLEVPADVRALMVFCYELALLSVPLYLLFIKPSVMAVLPAPEEGLYARLHSGVSRYFRAIVIVSTFLLALRAAGYVNASTFILVRGYGLFLLVVVAVALGARMRRWFRDRDTSSAGQEDLYKSLSWAARAATTGLLVVAGLKMLLLWEPLTTTLDIPLISIGEANVSAHSVLRAVVYFFIAVFVSRLIRAVLILRVFPAFDIDIGVGYAIQTLVNYAVIVVGFFVALIALGVNLSAMTVVFASLGVGIGFGLQTITENLISGFILLFGRSVKKGDIITVGDTYGHVEAVGARSVLIRHPDNYDMLVPSKEIVGGRITNWSYNDSLIRHRLPVGITYGANPRDVEEALLEAAGRHDSVLKDPAPEVWLKEFGDSSVNFTLLVFFDCRLITRDRLNGQLNFLVWDVLHERGLEIPFPQRDLHLKSIEFAEQLRGPQKQRGAGESDEQADTDAGAPEPD